MEAAGASMREVNRAQESLQQLYTALPKLLEACTSGSHEQQLEGHRQHFDADPTALHARLPIAAELLQEALRAKDNSRTADSSRVALKALEALRACAADLRDYAASNATDQIGGAGLSKLV